MSRGQHWVTEPDQEIEIKLGSSGFSALPPQTVISAFIKTVELHGDEKALAAKEMVNVCAFFSFQIIIITLLCVTFFFIWLLIL